MSPAEQFAHDNNVNAMLGIAYFIGIIGLLILGLFLMGRFHNFLLKHYPVKAEQVTKFVGWAVAILVTVFVANEIVLPKIRHYFLIRNFPTEAKERYAHDELDPSAVQFRSLYLVEFEEDKHQHLVLCGEVNSKNTFGAYTGFKRFVQWGEITNPPISWRETERGEYMVNGLWDVVCTRPKAGRTFTDVE